MRRLLRCAALVIVGLLVLGGAPASAVDDPAVPDPLLPQVPLPDLPVMAETLPGFVLQGWHGVMAPTGTPAPVAGSRRRILPLRQFTI